MVIYYGNVYLNSQSTHLMFGCMVSDVPFDSSFGVYDYQWYHVQQND